MVTVWTSWRISPPDALTLSVLDPPFNSKQQYHAIFRGSGLSIQPQIKAFDDMWHWDAESAQRVRDIKNAAANPASKVIAAFEMIIPNSEMLSYTSYMAQRLFEMHRSAQRHRQHLPALRSNRKPLSQVDYGRYLQREKLSE